MQYFAPYGSASSNASYVNGDPANAIEGSIPDARGFEATQREIVRVITAAGLTPSLTDNTQLAQATSGGLLNYFTDQGTVNAVAINPGLVYLGLTAGLKFRVKMAFAPTAGATFQVNLNAPVPIVKSGGSSLVGGEWAAGDIVDLNFDGANAQIGGLSGNTGLLITSNLTLNVPAQYPTIQAAVLAASKMVIASNVLVKILVASPSPGTPYIENLNTSTGPIDINLPYGNRVQIIGPTMNGTFPAESDIAGKSKSQCLAFLQGRFNLIINAVAVDGIQVHSGGLNLLENGLVVSDGTPGTFPIRVGDWQTNIGTGLMGIQNVWCHGGGQNGFDAQFLAAVRATNLGATYCYLDGIRSAHGCNIEVNFGNVVSMYNGDSGLYCANDGQFSIDSQSGIGTFAYNTKAGITAAACGKFNALPSAGNPGCGVILQNNGWGAIAYGQGLVSLPSTATFGSNATGDLYAYLNSDIIAAGTSPGTCSPARNTPGNNNSFIVV